ncbi:P-loop containing nucleoside triphosphate hydrolase protein [Nemania sp. FL0916]|nr:P-loop containing nucleoside triphosphate hydrolase protein [Nemania sp. FL0916]
MSLIQSETPEQQWQRKKAAGETSVALDELMSMIGLQEVKTRFIHIRDEFELNRKLYTGTKISRLRKTTVARIYSKLLETSQVFGSRPWKFVETSGALLASQGILGLKGIITGIQEVGVGALFVDEAYQLVNDQSSKNVLDYLTTVMETSMDSIVFMFAGYRSEMDKFYGHNRGIRDRIRYEFKFEDYDEHQIQQILRSQLIAHIGQTVQYATCQSQPQDPDFLLKVVARRISRRSGIEGFGNARTVENMAADIKSRHLARASHSSGSTAHQHYLLSEEDMLGPGFGVDFKSKALDALDEMIGLEEVKKSVRAMIFQICFNRVRELMDLPPLQESLNKVFLGNPGTGKTTVAELYGQILVDLGMLSNGEVVMKTSSDFISDVVGGSETRTRQILDATRGKVLVIDEAYGFGSRHGAKGVRGVTDSYRSGVIDTLVANIHSRAGDDRCVLLLGYKDKMEEMYQDINPGFKRRFPLDSAFIFEDFTAEQLQQIWKKNLVSRGLSTTHGANTIAKDMLERQRHKLNFGNAGEVEILLDTTQKRYMERIRDKPDSLLSPSILLRSADVDPDHERLKKANIDVEQLFKGVVGCDEVKETIRAWPTLISNAKKRNLDLYDLFPMSFAFTGPPGTGKTTTAKSIGTILYSLGLIASEEVNVISSTELIGEYIGQTGPKVRRQFEQSLGKVLFIDEAYRLCNSNYFGQDALDEIVTCLTEDKFKNHLFVIFAGYEGHIKHMLNQNPGLASRVPGKLHFPPLTAEAALELLRMHINNGSFWAVCLSKPVPAPVVQAMESLVSLDNWANGRSVETLSKDIKRAALSELSQDDVGVCYISRDIVLGAMGNMRRMLTKQLPDLGNRGPSRLNLYDPLVASDTMTDSEPKMQMKEEASTQSPAATPSNTAKRKSDESSSDQSPSQAKKQRGTSTDSPSNPELGNPPRAPDLKPVSTLPEPTASAPVSVFNLSNLVPNSISSAFGLVPPKNNSNPGTQQQILSPLPKPQPPASVPVATPPNPIPTPTHSAFGPVPPKTNPNPGLPASVPVPSLPNPPVPVPQQPTASSSTGYNNTRSQYQQNQVGQSRTAGQQPNNTQCPHGYYWRSLGNGQDVCAGGLHFRPTPRN